MLYDIGQNSMETIGDYPGGGPAVTAWINNSEFIQTEHGKTQILDTSGNVVKEFVE